MEESMQIGAYQLLSPFEMKDGGNCEWTFANKGGKTYFIKKEIIADMLRFALILPFAVTAPF